VGCVTIHSTHPFATPDGQRSPVRQLRGRLPAAVTLWTAADPDGGRVGLTVSSTVVVDGEPGRLIGLLDPESDLCELLERVGRYAVAPLRAEDGQLAEKFAGLMPAPGGAFRGHDWLDTPFGPVLAGVSGWAGCRVDRMRPLGWSVLVEATVEHIDITDSEPAPLVHHRGRYTSPR
jgi:3-hydroxy-9,10-secoandrosta-1,3,5(10)-triene-9,17-dione monooxygenase reductase component